MISFKKAVVYLLGGMGDEGIEVGSELLLLNSTGM